VKLRTKNSFERLTLIAPLERGLTERTFERIKLSFAQASNIQPLSHPRLDWLIAPAAQFGRSQLGVALVATIRTSGPGQTSTRSQSAASIIASCTDTATKPHGGLE
jgi:hypothetical protein